MVTTSDHRRVVITGVGALTPSGADVESTWRAVLAGRSGIGPLEGDAFADLPIRIGGQIHDFNPVRVLGHAAARHVARVVAFAVAAADEAMAAAGVGFCDAPGGSPLLPWRPDRFSIISATGSGPVETMQGSTRALDTLGPRGVSPWLSVYGSPDAASSLLSLRYGAMGTAHAVSAACASGAAALGEGMRAIRHGYADAVLVVGSEDCLNPVNLAANTNLRALARGWEDDPARASRPFDRRRNGFVMSQGAAAVLIEAAETAAGRSTNVLAELAGYGAASDAHHATAPDPEGRGAAIAIQACLDDAGVTADEVDTINAHATGTLAGDAAEIAALRSTFGDALADVPISATKSSTGHLLGASGTLEAIIAAYTLRDDALPPTANLTEPDPAFADVDFVTGRARPAAVHTVISNAFGFGGHNASLLLRAPQLVTDLHH